MKTIKSFIKRLVIVAIVAVFPALLIGLGVPGIISGVQGVLEMNQPSQVIDLSGPKVIRTCPGGMDLKTTTETRENFNRNGTVTNVTYACVGANGATAQPTETFETPANPPPSLAQQNFFFSPAADWLRLIAYPISFALVLGLSFFVRTDSSEAT